MLHHETQRRQLCGKHAINNLLQLPPSERLTTRDLDNIADEMYEKERQLYCTAVGQRVLLSNSHRRHRWPMLGSFGNYSFEVVYEALRVKGYDMVKLRPSVDFVSEWMLNDHNVVGVMLNGPSVITREEIAEKQRTRTRSLPSFISKMFAAKRVPVERHPHSQHMNDPIQHSDGAGEMHSQSHAAEEQCVSHVEGQKHGSVQDDISVKRQCRIVVAQVSAGDLSNTPPPPPLQQQSSNSHNCGSVNNGHGNAVTTPGGHWFALGRHCKEGGSSAVVWYNHDSYLRKPLPLKDNHAVHQFIRSCMQRWNTQAWKVVKL